MPIVRDDGRLGTAFRLRFTPLHIVIGRDGRIAYVGHKLDDGFEAALAAVRSPASVAAAEGSAGAPAPADGPQFHIATRPALSTLCRQVREQVADLPSDSRIRWLGVASGLWATRKDLRQYRTDHNVRIPLRLDETGVLFRSFRVTNVPTILIADETGTITRRMELGDARGLQTALQTDTVGQHAKGGS